MRVLPVDMSRLGTQSWGFLQMLQQLTHTPPSPVAVLWLLCSATVSTIDHNAGSSNQGPRCNFQYAPNYTSGLAQKASYIVKPVSSRSSARLLTMASSDNRATDAGAHFLAHVESYGAPRERTARLLTHTSESLTERTGDAQFRAPACCRH